MPGKCVLVSDFTIDPIIPYLKAAPSPQFECILTPLDQVRHTLQDPNQECWQQQPEVTLLWTLPYKQIAGFAKLLYQDDYDRYLVEQEVKQFASYIKIAAERTSVLLMPVWTLPHYFRGRGALNWRNDIGIYNVLARINLQLADLLHQCSNVYLLNSQRWMLAVPEVIDERMWFLGKIPFSRDLFCLAAAEIKAAIRAIQGQTRKLLVLDLDNVLWGGEVGELGREGINLGGIDPIGEAYVEFQKQILALKNRGILLAIASKNEEDVALDAINKHRAMILRKEDFVAWRINWQDKAMNIAAMVSELNLGLQSVVFIDDSPIERARVAEALPEVYVPEWPEDPIEYRQALGGLDCFDSVSYSYEDKVRSQLYHDEKRRKDMLAAVPSLEGWLHSLDLRLSYEEISLPTLPRVVQLINKVNQFNLITRRMEKHELIQYARNRDHNILVFHLSDRIGKYGLIGVVSYEVDKADLEIRDFVVSCRALGRGVERAMLHLITLFCRQHHKKTIVAQYIPTKKNKPCATFLPDNGFKPAGENSYRHDCPDTIALPAYIILERRNITTSLFRI